MKIVYLIFFLFLLVSKLQAQDIYITYISSTYNDEYNVSCNGASDGWIKIIFTGGKYPFLFNWSNGSYDQNLKNIPAGDFTLKIIDANSDTGKISINLSEPDPIIVQLNRSRYDGGFNISTYGGHDGYIESEISGGIPEFKYLWSTESTERRIENLTENTYTLTVTDMNGCKAKASVTLTEPKELFPVYKFK